MSDRSPPDTDPDDWGDGRGQRAGDAVAVVATLTAALVVLGTGVPAVSVASAATPTQVTSCTTIDTPGTYALSSDVSTTATGDCIRITASDVVLDGAGHGLSGPWSEGDSTYSAAVNVTGSNVTVRDLTAEHWARGVTVAGSTRGHTVANVTVRHAWFGVRLGESRAVDDSRVTRSHVDDVRVGVQVDAFGSNNTVGNLSSGRVHRSDLVVLADATGTVVRDSDLREVLLAGASETRVANNTLVDVVLDGADDNVLVGNTVDGHGVQVRDGSDRNVIRHNDVRNGISPVEISESDGNRLVSNVVTGASSWGMTVDSATDTTIADTVFRDNRVGVFVIGGGEGVTIRNNTLAANEEAGVTLHRASGARVTGNTMRNNSQYGVRVWNAGPNDVRDNTVVNSTEAGVLVDRSDGVRVSDNDVRGGPSTSDEGITVEESTDVTATGNHITDARVALYGIASAGLTVTDTTVRDGGFGPSVYDSRDVVVRNVALVDNHEHPLRFRNVTGTSVRDVSARGNGEGGIRLADLTDARVENVTATGNEFGLSVLPAANVTVAAVSASGGDRFGVRVGDGHDVGVAGVSAVDNRGRGLVVTRVRNVTVAGATVRGNHYGVHLDRVRDATVREVTAEANAYAGARVDDSTGVDLERIDAAGNGVTGVRLHGVNRTALVDSVTDAQEYGVWLSGSRGVTIANHTARSNAYDGVRLFDGATVTVRGATTTDNRFGVRAIATANSTVADTVARGNDWAGIRVSADSWKGVGAGPSAGNRLVNVSSTDNGLSAIRLLGTADTTAANATVVGGDPGVWLSDTDGTRLLGLDTGDNRPFDLLAAGGSTVEARNHTLGDGTTVGYEATNVSIDTVETPPPDPAGYTNVTAYVEAGRTSSAASLDLNVSYADAAVAAADVDESSLRLWAHDGSWAELPAENQVNTMTDTVHASVTDFGVVAPLGEETNATGTATADGREVTP